MHIQCILPHLDYCCVIWGNCSRSHEEKIVNLQKRAGRLILNIDCDTPSTFLFSQLKWMTFPESVIYQKEIQMYTTLSGTSPNYLKIPFTFTPDIHFSFHFFYSVYNETIHVHKCYLFKTQKYVFNISVVTVCH